MGDLTKNRVARKGRRSQGLLESRRQRLPVGGDDAPHGSMMLTQTSDADPFIVGAIPDHPRDLDLRPAAVNELLAALGFAPVQPLTALG